MANAPILSRTTLLTALVLFAVPLAVLALWPQLNTLAIRDAAPPDDSDFSLQPPGSPKDYEAFDLLMQAAASVASETSSDRRGQDEIGQLLWESNPAAVQALLARHEGALKLFDEVLGQSSLRLAEDRPNAGDEERTPFALRRLGQLAALRALQQSAQGKVAAALEQSLAIVQLGQRVEGAGGNLRIYRGGQEITLAGLAAMQQILARREVAGEELSRILESLADPFETSSALAESLRAEYWRSVRLLDDLPSLARHLEDGDWEGTLRKTMVRWGGPGKPNRTRTRLAEDYRRLIGATTEDYRDIAGERLLPRELPFWEGYLAGNASLEAIYTELFPSLRDIYFRKANETTALAITRALAAIQCYQADHGAVPPSLEALVPDYLDEVPRDHFAGESLRYLPGQKLLYPTGVRLNPAQGGPDRQVQTRVLRVSFN